MKAAIFDDIKKITYVEDYPIPKFKPNEALVKVHYCGICGSDISNFKYKIYQTPLIMGHEFSGEVIELGKDVSNFNVGDRVCGINVSLSLKEKELKGLGIFQNGGFAEYVNVPSEFLFRIPPELSTKEGAMIESFANVFRAMKLSNIQDNQKILIIGGGNIGLCFLSTLTSIKNPKYIVVIERHKFLREKAIILGATESLPPIPSKIKRFLKKQGSPSIIFDCVASEQTLNLSIQIIERRGTILVEGMHMGNISLPIFAINSKEICLQGSLGHSRENILDTIVFLSKKKIDLNEFISKTVSLKDLHETFESYLTIEERDFVKTIVKMV